MCFPPPPSGVYFYAKSFSLISISIWHSFSFSLLLLPDFGIDALTEHVEKTNFPWLISNVIDNETGRPLAEGKITHVLDWWGRKIGLVRRKQYPLQRYIHRKIENMKLAIAFNELVQEREHIRAYKYKQRRWNEFLVEN